MTQLREGIALQQNPNTHGCLCDGIGRQVYCFAARLDTIPFSRPVHFWLKDALSRARSSKQRSIPFPASEFI